jgi:hypothetical protein
MLLIIQITFAIVLAHYFIIERPRIREADRKATRERAAADREMERDRARHAYNAAAKAALEPELAKLDVHVRTQFLIAWEDGEAAPTRESLARFVEHLPRT